MDDKVEVEVVPDEPLPPGARRRFAETSDTEDSSDEEKPIVRKLGGTRLNMNHVSVRALEALRIEYEIDPNHPGFFLIKRPILGEEITALREYTRKSRMEEAERMSQNRRQRSTAEQEPAVLVIEYNPPRDGVRGITQIPKHLTNAQNLESLGWYVYEVKNGFFEIKFPLRKEQIDQIITNSKDFEDKNKSGTPKNVGDGKSIYGEPSERPPNTSNDTYLPPRQPYVEREYDDDSSSPRRYRGRKRRSNSYYDRKRHAILGLATGAFANPNLDDGPLRYGEGRNEGQSYSPPRRTASPEPLDSRHLRRSRERERVMLSPAMLEAINKLEELREKRDKAREQGDRTLMEDLSYYAIPDLEAFIENLRKAEGTPREREVPQRVVERDQRHSRSRLRWESRERYDYERDYYDRRTKREENERQRSREYEYYDDLPVRGRYQEPTVEIDRNYRYMRSPSPPVIIEERYAETDEIYEPPESGGKSLKFDINLLSLTSEVKNNHAAKAPRPNKSASKEKPEIVSIETSRRYTGDSGGETVVLSTGLKAPASQPGHLRWIHLTQHHMSFDSLQQLLLQTDDLNNDDMLIALQLLRKIQDEGGEKPFVHGYYQQPAALRCDAHDIGDETKPDRTCTFLCFPYFSFQNAPSPSSKNDVRMHSARGLLQTLYYLESTKARDLEQVIRKLRPPKGDEAIYVSQMWAIVLGSHTLITYSAAPLATMRGDKIQITKPITTIRTGPSTLRVTDPFERLFFFSLDQCKTWFELTNLIHDQCLHSYGYSIDECNIFLKNDQQLKAPSWSAAIEAEKSPIVNIHVRFKTPQELEEDEMEKAEAQRDRRRYRADDIVYERDSSVPPSRRLIRNRDTLDSYDAERRSATRPRERVSRPNTLDNYTSERPSTKLHVVERIKTNSQHEEGDYYARPRLLPVATPSRRGTKDKESTALVIRARSRSRSKDRFSPRSRDLPYMSSMPKEHNEPLLHEDTETRIVRRRENRDSYGYEPVRNIVVRERERGASQMVRENIGRRRDRNPSRASITRQHLGPRYQGGGIVLNESKRGEKAETSTADIYYIPEKRSPQDVPSVQVTGEQVVNPELPPPPRERQRQPARRFSLRRQSSLDAFDRKPSVRPPQSEKIAESASTRKAESAAREPESSAPSDHRPRSKSSTRMPLVVKPSVPPILMWPVGRAASPAQHIEAGSDATAERENANESAIRDLLDRVHDHLLADRYYEHSRLFLATAQATRHDPLFQSMEKETAKRQDLKLPTESSSAQPETVAAAEEATSPSRNATSLHPEPEPAAETELDKALIQFHEISSELLDAFLPANYPSPVAGRYYGAVKKTIEILRISNSHYFMNEGRNATESTVYEIHDVRLDPEYLQDHGIKAPRNEFSTCSKCASNHIYKFESEAFDHLRHVHFKPENGSSDGPSTTELRHWIKAVTRISVERCAGEQLRVLQRCCQHLFNLQTESREIRDGVSTDDKVHQARYRLPKALVESFQRLVMLLVYTTYVLDVITKNNEQWLSRRWESENDREYTKAYDHMIFLGTGAEVNMEQGKLDLLQMIRLEDYTQSVSYEAVGPEYILSMVMQNLQGGLNCTDLVDVYKEWAERLAYQVSLRPRKRLLRDFQYLSEEIKVLSSTLEDQWSVLENFRRCLVPNSFRITTETRVSMYAIEKMLLSKICEMNENSFDDYEEIDRKVERLVSQTKMSIEILDDDHGKAIFVFTVVTLIFLPLSFVASLLGMNTVDIRNQTTTQWLFWAIALPITAVVVGLALVVAYRFDEMREWIDKKTKKELSR